VIHITLTNYSITVWSSMGIASLSNVTSQNTPLIPTWNVTSELTITWPDAKDGGSSGAQNQSMDILGGTVTLLKQPARLQQQAVQPGAVLSIL